jgi:hypothetical protein
VVSDLDVHQCNGAGATFRHDFALFLTGKTSSHNVFVTDSNLQIILSSVSLSESDPFSVVRSSVSVVLLGSNRIDSFATTGVSCSEGSNLSIRSDGDGSLSVLSTGSAAAIGASALSHCNSVEIVNGSYTVSGGTGIGASANSTLETFVIRGGRITAAGTVGSAVGGGYSELGGSSAVGEFRILNAVINAAGEDGRLSAQDRRTMGIQPFLS